MTEMAVTATDLSNCAREPIHIPGAIQPYGALLVLDGKSLIVRQAAVTPGMPLADARSLIGKSLSAMLPVAAQWLPDALQRRAIDALPLQLGNLEIATQRYHAIAHRQGDALLLELEAVVSADEGNFETLYPTVQSYLRELEVARGIEELGRIAVRQIRELTGLDRVLLYRFDAEWNGTVSAEERSESLPSYLDLRFPADDIPAQARELYRRNRIRLIANSTYTPVPIEPTLDPTTGKPVDLSYAVLRSVSPVHLEYMRNMGTGASMSISLLRGDRLWGLISCHHGQPHRVPVHIRTACDLLGQVFSMQIGVLEQAGVAQQRSALRGVQAQLLTFMAAEDSFLDGLIRHEPELLGLMSATGAAVVAKDTCALLGNTPAQEDVLRIVDWLATRGADVFHTEQLALDMPNAERFADMASGVLAISISQLHRSFVIWFRREVIQTVRWAGEPRKAQTAERLHPRRSFEAWKEQLRLRAVPWADAEVEAARELRRAIVDIVLRKAEELAALSDQLMRINKELEAFSYSVSHDLRAPFRHIVGYSQLLQKNESAQLTDRARRYINTIIDSARSAGELVDDLLSFSQMGRATMHPIRVNMNQLFSEARQRLSTDMQGRNIDWRVQSPLPLAMGDPSMLRLVAQNLLDNAIKFTIARSNAVIEIGGYSQGEQNVYFVRDDGAGFDMQYVNKLFGVFQRLHRIEEFDGTGIGLASIKRIVERHGGRAWAEGAVDQGATFYFSLPAAEGQHASA